MIFAGFVFAAAVVGASAQDLSSLSSSCREAATSILTGPASTCLAIPGIVGIATTPSDQSLITPINNWLTSVCATPACTNATLDATISTISTGCSDDLSTIGYSSRFIEAMGEEFKGWYPTGREVACLKDTSSDAFCVTSTLKAFEEWIGTPFSINTAGDFPSKLTPEIPKDLVCTPCIQAAYRLISPRLDDYSRQSWPKFLSEKCGSSFVDGSAPAGIKQSANAAAAGSSSNGASSNGAMSLSSGLSSATFLVGAAGLAALAL